MVIRLPKRVHELINIVRTYEKEHGPIDENAPKEIQDADKELTVEIKKLRLDEYY